MLPSLNVIYLGKELHRVLDTRLGDPRRLKSIKSWSQEKILSAVSSQLLILHSVSSVRALGHYCHSRVTRSCHLSVWTASDLSSRDDLHNIG